MKRKFTLKHDSAEKMCASLHVKSHAAILGAFTLLAILSSAQSVAGNMYVFKDKQGNVLLTNVVGSNKKPKGNQFSTFNTKVKVTWYKDTNVHTYKNWGKSESAVLPSYSKNKNAYDALIRDAASRHGLDASLMKAIMHTESGFNPNARSPVGAQGLMQLMPATASRFGVQNAWNPADNIEGSAKYLKYLKKRFNGNTSLILAGYNAGEGNVDKYGGIPPFKETQNYVKKVKSRYHNLYQGKLANTRGSMTVFSPSTSRGKIIDNSRIDDSYIDNSYEASAFAALKR